MKFQHISHTKDEWFDLIETDYDCDFETGEYIGIDDRIKLSDGRWYSEVECLYRKETGDILSCKK
jgi:hypothetical protein